MIEGLSRALLVVNAGSSSVKFSVFAIGTGDTRLASLSRGEVHGLGAHPHFVARDANDARLVDQAMGPAATHDDALGAIFESIETRAMGTEVLPELLGADADRRIVVAHLGAGASMCALRGRRSVATTMGFTALDGLPMATRPGAIDPGVILHLMSGRGMSVAAVTELLYKQSGLLGMSGVSADMRDLLVSDAPRAARALDVFVYRVGRELGSLAAALGGLDALVFTAGIGEHAPAVRGRVCRDAAWLGIRLDEAANAAGGPRVSVLGRSASAWVIPTNEELIIARHTLALTGS